MNMPPLLHVYIVVGLAVAVACSLPTRAQEITCRYPTLCAKADEDALGGETANPCSSLVESGHNVIPCLEGLPCVHPRAYWQQHPRRWPPEVDTLEPICGLSYKILLFDEWPHPGAPAVCQTLTQAVVIGRVNEAVVEYGAFPEPTRYLLTEGERVANDCCAQVGVNEALDRELKRLLHRFNDGNAPAAEGGLPACPVNETVANGVPGPYTGRDAEAWHYLFYGNHATDDVLVPRGIVLVTAFYVGIVAAVLAAAIRCRGGGGGDGDGDGTGDGNENESRDERRDRYKRGNDAAIEMS